MEHHAWENAWENFDIKLDLRSRAISNFPTHLEVKYSRQKTLTGITFYIYQTVKLTGTLVVLSVIPFNSLRFQIYVTQREK